MSSSKKRRHPVVTVLLTIAFTVAAGGIGLFLLSLTDVKPANLGVQDGRLASCPSSPNCVSTQASDQEHWIAPLTSAPGGPSPIETLADILRPMPRVTIVEQSNNYMRAEFRSRIFRFCDDVEFFFEAESGRVHFRSASRVGHSDLGVNRQRMEMIRELFIRETARSGSAGSASGASVRFPGRKSLAGVR